MTFNVKGEILIDDDWVDVSNRIYYKNGISISKGQTSEGNPDSIPAMTAALVFKNQDGWAVPENPRGIYYGRIGRNTKFRVSNADLVNVGKVSDNFNRTVANSWGTSSSGHAWTFHNSSSAELSVDGSQGLITVSSTYNDYRHMYIASEQIINAEAVVAITSDTVAAASTTYRPSILFRHIDPDPNGIGLQGIFVGLSMEPSGLLKVFAEDKTDGVIGLSIDTQLVYAANTKIWLRAQLIGQRVKARVWLDGSTEPTQWLLDYNANTTEIGVPSYPHMGHVGILLTMTGAPTGTKIFKFDDFTVTDPTAGYRFYGSIPDWNPNRGQGKEKFVNIQAAGLLRQLTQGEKPLESALKRYFLSIKDELVAYWPCEDDSESDQAASAISEIPAMEQDGGVNFSSNSDFACSQSIPTMNSGRLSAQLPVHKSNEQIRIWFLLKVPSGGATDNQQIISMRMTGTANLWQLRYNTGGGYVLECRNSEDALITSFTISHSINGQKCLVALQLEDNGADIAGNLSTYKIQSDGSLLNSVDTFDVTGRTIGRVIRLHAAYNQGLTDTAIGHIAYSNVGGNTVFNLKAGLNPVGAWISEPAGKRIKRLADEEEIPFVAFGDLDDTELMGAQLVNNRTTLWNDAALVDGGLIYETEYEESITYRTRKTLQNQTAKLTIDGTASPSQNKHPFEVASDDKLLRNDITVSKPSGSSARVIKSDGPQSVLAPPQGLGTYEQSLTRNVANNADLSNQAGWHVHLGTFGALRVPKLSVILEDESTTFQKSAFDTKLGDKITLTNPPTDLPPDNLEQLVLGYTEYADKFMWRITYVGIPARTYTLPKLGNAIKVGTRNTQILDDPGRGVGAGTALTPDYIIVPDSQAGQFAINSRVQLTDSGGIVKSSVADSNGEYVTVFTVTSKNSAGGFTNIFFSPNLPAVTVLNDRIHRADETLLPMQIGVVEGFGDSAYAFDWSNAGDLPWFRSKTTPDEGPWSLKSGNIKKNQTSDFVITVPLWADTVQFRYRTSSESGFDFFRFLINGVSQFTASGNGVWTSSSAFSVSDKDELTFRYEKDGNTDSFEDSVYIDKVRLYSLIDPVGGWRTSGVFPYDINVGGERMTVTAVSSATTLSTFTVTRGVNGIYRAHPMGTPVHMWDRMVVGL